ncbi:MAG: TRAP transporter substrate-binding protein [Planctomycetota bacterium]|jgi:tripartite ATP-independent transporter DctP family solute receptor
MDGLDKIFPHSLLFLICIFVALVPGCSRETTTDVIKLGHGLDPTHPVHQAMVFLAEQVHERSQGRLRIDIYPSEQLGSERECIELLQIGSLGMTKVSSSALEGFVPAINVLGLPYLFRDEAHRFQVLEGEIGRKLLLEAQEYWLRGLCFYDAGSRSFYTKEKPVLRPADLQGYKIRTQESPTAMRMVQALGGAPTPIAWGELYTALQQGVVDGAENNPPSFHLSRHYEVCKHYALDEHTAVPDVLIISTLIWEDLTADLQTILQEAADASAQEQKRLWKKATERALAEVQKAGVTVHYPEKRLFSDKVAPMYEEFKNDPEMSELIRRIRAED